MSNIPTMDENKVQKALIGDLIIEFEQISAFIRYIILIICYPNHTLIQNNNIETLLEGLTSDPLRKKLEALIYDNYSECLELLELNKKLSDKFNLMIQIRNSIAHGSLLIGWKNFNGELSADTFLLKHTKTTKTGIDRNSKIINIKSIERLNKQMQTINSAYSNLCVLINKDISNENRELYLKRLKNLIDKIGSIELNFETKVSK